MYFKSLEQLKEDLHKYEAEAENRAKTNLVVGSSSEPEAKQLKKKSTLKSNN